MTLEKIDLPDKSEDLTEQHIKDGVAVIKRNTEVILNSDEIEIESVNDLEVFLLMTGMVAWAFEIVEPEDAQPLGVIETSLIKIESKISFNKDLLIRLLEAKNRAILAYRYLMLRKLIDNTSKRTTLVSTRAGKLDEKIDEIIEAQKSIEHDREEVSKIAKKVGLMQKEVQNIQEETNKSFERASYLVAAFTLIITNTTALSGSQNIREIFAINLSLLLILIAFVSLSSLFLKAKMSFWEVAIRLVIGVGSIIYFVSFIERWS